MRREFPTSIYVGIRAPRFPRKKHRHVSLLDIVRAERAIRAREKELARKMARKEVKHRE